MVSLVDVDATAGNSKRALEDLTADRAAAAAKPNEAKSPTAEPNATANGANEDPRFAGKSREEILSMYENLETHQGRLANELGQQRRTLDELLLQKRTTDLSANGAKVPEVNPADLLTRPQEVLDGYVTARARELVEPVMQRLNQLEGSLASTTFNGRHSDSTEVANSPEFRAWVRQTPLRQQLAQSAAQGNVQAADALLTEFKVTRPAKQGRNLEAALESAGRVALESNQADTGAAAKPAGKTFKRTDLMALRARDPDAYNRMGDEIMRAYREGRVV